MSKFFFSLLVSNTAPEKMSHEPLEAFVDNDEGCFFHPAILPLMPYLIDEERKLLDADDLDFIDEDAEPVGKFLTTKVPQIRPNCPIRSITSLISMEDAILSSRVPLGASKAAKKITIYRVVKSSKNEKSLSSGPYRFCNKSELEFRNDRMAEWPAEWRKARFSSIMVLS